MESLILLMNSIYDYAYKTLFLLRPLIDNSSTRKIQKNLQRKMFEDLKRKNLPSLLEVPEFDYKKHKFENFPNEFYCKTRPIVFRGLAKEWGCCKKWDFDFFKERFGDSEVIIDNQEGFNRNTEMFKTSLREYFERYYNDPQKYLSFCQLIHKENDLLKELDWNVLNKLRPKTARGDNFLLFMGGNSCSTPIHSGMSSNFFVMVHGSKKWRIFPKEYFSLLDIESNDRTHTFSRVDIDNPDPVTHPDFNLIPRYEFVLNQGDVLFNPPWLYHSVQNLTNSVGLRYGLPNFTGNIRISKTQTINRLFGGYNQLFTSIKGFYKKKAIPT